MDKELKLYIRNNAFYSIHQGLVHFDRADKYDQDDYSKEIEFDHDDQMTSYKDGGKLFFYLDDLYYIPPNYYELLFSIQHFTRGIELLFLDIVGSKKENDIFSSNRKKKTINFWAALNKALEIIPGLLSESQIESLKSSKELRNNIEHFELQSNYTELYIITSQLLSVINGIFRIHLHINLLRFYEFDCWKNDFHGKFTSTINNALQCLKKDGHEFNHKLLENSQDLSYCLFCDEKSYSGSENMCLFCLSEIEDELKDLL